jgi:hypothetical protein
MKRGVDVAHGSGEAWERTLTLTNFAPNTSHNNNQLGHQAVFHKLRPHELLNPIHTVLWTFQSELCTPQVCVCQLLDLMYV